MPFETTQSSQADSEIAIVLANDLHNCGEFKPELACVGTLPILLRAILAVARMNPDRIVVILNSITGARIRSELSKTGRPPRDIEWMEFPVATPLSHILDLVATGARRIDFILGDRTYHPDLHKMIKEWNGEDLAIELVSAGRPVGLFSLSHEAASYLAAGSELGARSGLDLHHWIARHSAWASTRATFLNDVPEEMWQIVACPDDLVTAEAKLDQWLVKPTDGIFARMNRSISIPISRQLIKFAITPNMVSFFVLGVSVASGLCFARGGYWMMLLGAVLSAWTSILDGCDGEVARLKLQVSDLGCWIDTICDYLYYFIIFAGMTIGLVRSKSDPSFFAWGAAIFVGAFITFLTASIGRNRLSGDHPEKYLAVWQKKAEKRSAGLLVNMGRYTEFIVRRCFLPYLVLFFAILGGMQVLLYLTAIGANIAWVVSLRSLIAFSSKPSGTIGAKAPKQKRTLLSSEESSL